MNQDEKKSFVMYTEWAQVFEMLPADECKQLILAVIGYVQTGREVPLSATAAMAFTLMRGQLDRDAVKWDEARKQRSEAGKKSARVRKENSLSDAQQIRPD